MLLAHRALDLRSKMRSGAAASFLLAIFVFVSLSSMPVESAVASIDLGSEWMKVAVVNLKPGQSPISIVINEMSKRKSPALVGFNAGNRLVGEEAAGIAARYPNKVYSQFRDMIGKPYKYVKDIIDSLYLPFDLVEDSRGAAGFKTDDGVVYSAEELLAMILRYGMGLAESHTRSPIKDAVISVPPYFGQAERRGVLQAAQLAGINVLSLINEHSGAALQYGIDKDFSNNSGHVIFYDMGSRNTYAALVYFSAYNTKEFGKTVFVNQFQIKDVSWKTNLGGQNMELRLVEHFADEFNKELGNGADVRNSPKAMAKLKKQVKRTKEILSTNTVAPLSVESLYDEQDFRSTISREKFEEICEDLWEQSLLPVEEILKHSNLTVDDVLAIELIGGATRVPKLQAKLQEFLRRKDLDKHLDADEAIALGSSLLAANLSDGIKLNRKLGMIDGSSYGFMVELTGVDLVKDESTHFLLVPRMKKMPIKLFRSIKHSKDFDVSLSYDGAYELPPGVSSAKFVEFSVSGLAEAAERYSTRNLSSPIKATMHFSLSRSGLISFDRAEAVIELSEWVEVPKNIKTSETNATNSLNAIENLNLSAEGSPMDFKDSKKESMDIDNEPNSGINAEVKDNVAVETEKVLKRRTFKVPLKIVEKQIAPGILSKEMFLEVKTRLDDLDKKDLERRRTAELKNSLEEYIYSIREKLDDNEEIKKISSEDELGLFEEKLSEAQDWLYTDGEDASANEFKKRLDSLKAIGDPIFFRLSELTARPTAYESAHNYLVDIQKVVDNWEKNKPWLPKSRVDEILSDADKFDSWLKEKEALQKMTSQLITPVITSEEIYDRVSEIQDKISSVNRIPKPKTKVEKAPKEEESISQENSTNASKLAPDKNSTQKDQSTEESSKSPSTNLEAEPELHDEL
ncbi:heat shock 70 kDa protein 17 [Phalaenopsis equestris]|uniref:heat shock 70 kDa protein 17 n=1 Tax=Phalaenopsis equestris TaxID=78828 RepID=UPI0009E1CE26|nr:heat shock 70 kDa protein 17 [Phalaenopsis equestris]